MTGQTAPPARSASDHGGMRQPTSGAFMSVAGACYNHRAGRLAFGLGIGNAAAVIPMSCVSHSLSSQ